MLQAQPDLFAPRPLLPAGFAYGEDVISADEERDLVEHFARLPFAPFEFHGYLGKRRIVSFGWRYDYGGRALRPAQPIPDFLRALRQRAAQFAGLDAEDLRQVLVTEYAPGAGIGWHRDKPMFQDVVALSFLTPCLLRFRRRNGDRWQRMSQIVPPRAAYRLSGAARQDWEHSIPPLDALRYSVTFRNFVAGYAPPT